MSARRAVAMPASSPPVARATNDETSVASRRVIEANGGRYLDTIGPKRRYHVPTSG